VLRFALVAFFQHAYHYSTTTTRRIIPEREREKERVAMRLLSSSLTTLTKTTLSSFGRLSRRRFRRLSTSSSRFVQRRNDDKIQTRNNGALFFAMMSPVVVLIDGGSGGGATMMTTTTQFVMRMGVDATLAASIALAAMHSYARSNDDDDDLDENDDDENENDLRTRWTVASLVALLPVFGVVSWILPRVSVGSWEVEETSEEEAKRQKRCALYAAMYLASYAAFGGFDVTRKETWVVTALSFAHFQIESPFGALKKRNAKEEQDETGTFAIEEIAASLKASVLGGASSNSSSSGSNSRSSSSNRSSSVTGAEKRRDAERSNSSFAKHLGEYLGELQVQLRNLPMDVEEGRIRAQIEREIDATEQMLEREKSIASDEIEKWDRKWMLRRMKKPELIETCKRNGIKGYSRLNKMDIVEMIEKFEEQEEASVEEA